MDNKVLHKLILTGIFVAVGFTLSTFVVFPNMAPFQHMINVLAAVFLGPAYGTLAAFITGLLRMMMGRSILAIVGGVFGACLSGILYRTTRNFIFTYFGEVVGTGIISAIVGYYIMKLGFGVPLKGFYFYIPFFLPSSAVGGFIGMLILYRLRKVGFIDKYNKKYGE